MPTTITSAGVTFNDTTSLTSANIGTAQLVNGSVTAAKLGTTEQKQICKAWVNFSGTAIASVATNAGSGQTISCSSGSTTGTWSDTGWVQANVGLIYKFTQINGVVGATFGGVDVSTLGVQVISVVAGVSATFRFLSGTTTSAQSVTGTGSSSSGFSYIGTGIRSSYNVSSVTKNGIGDYTVNFTTAMTDANYSSVIAGRKNLDGLSANLPSFYNTAFNTGNVRVASTIIGNNGSDSDTMSVAIFGN
jgi:hypothetical protein